ncbi:hypothetical protein CYMTET_46133 [Cymbomonas tetramitiformis]|uniref:Uncharacterized protein n=1 Tax=Cymbomonas tetramitiformis TaxID=36881 RepID=A0AAE0BWR8_9CHLO|nr:hypothetical protein CYMTET_46133 [Cymbomonas tetramitiformis]
MASVSEDPEITISKFLSIHQFQHFLKIVVAVGIPILTLLVVISFVWFLAYKLVLFDLPIVQELLGKKKHKQQQNVGEARPRSGSSGRLVRRRSSSASVSGYIPPQMAVASDMPSAEVQ